MEANFEDLISQLDYYFIEGGIYFFSDVLMILDNKYYLYHKKHPPSPLFILPINGKEPDFNELIFYNDCLAYLHDIPFVFYSRNFRNRMPFKPIMQYPKNFNGYDELYYSNLRDIFTCIIDIKFQGYIPFLWEGAYRKTINISLYIKYSKALKEIQLYSMALKQIDPLMEFLCYYRIIESCSGSNGKEWIENNLDGSLKFNYGFLEIYDVIAAETIKKRINIFSVYKSRARNRIKSLKQKLNNTSMGKYLYNTIL